MHKKDAAAFKVFPVSSEAFRSVSTFIAFEDQPPLLFWGQRGSIQVRPGGWGNCCSYCQAAETTCVKICLSWHLTHPKLILPPVHTMSPVISLQHPPNTNLRCVQALAVTSASLTKSWPSCMLGLLLNLSTV